MKDERDLGKEKPSKDDLGDTDDQDVDQADELQDDGGSPGSSGGQQ